jgi:glycosyltransferase involved in cell wall biosynthesis
MSSLWRLWDDGDVNTSKTIPLSLVIIAKNEADRIGRAIKSVPFAAEVLVLDSGSEDATMKVARDLGARVIETDWPGFGPQKNRAIAAASESWVLCLDADEWLDEDAADAVKRCVAAGRPGGFQLLRVNHWCGREILGGAWGPSYKLRLAPREGARWSDAQVHEVMQADGVSSKLAGRLMHDPFRGPAEHLKQIASYAELFVVESHRIGRQASLMSLGVRPILHFVKALLLRGGFRDGALGWLLAWLGAGEVALKWSLLWLDGGKSRDGTGLAIDRE